ncbi:unnamed protein product [Musa hybrid cultivar]
MSLIIFMLGTPFISYPLIGRKHLGLCSKVIRNIFAFLTHTFPGENYGVLQKYLLEYS